MWHPDINKENPDAFKEEFLELTEAWNVFKKGPGHSEPSQTESSGFQDDEFVWSDPPSEDEEEYNSTPFSEEFFIPSPKKNFAVPNELRAFIISGSNRRAGKFLALFTVQSNLKLMKYLCDHLSLYHGNVLCFIGWSTRTNKDILVILLNFNYERRLVDALRRTCVKPRSLLHSFFIVLNLTNLRNFFMQNMEI